MSLIDLTIKNIKKVMKEKKIKQVQLAEHLGISPQYISDIFRKVRYGASNVEFLERVAGVLGVNVLDLFQEDFEVKDKKINEVIDLLRRFWCEASDEQKQWLLVQFKVHLPLEDVIKSK